MLRFAPSPTGDMHIGNLRVALFNYIYSKQVNETLGIRIEDTDLARNIKGKDSEIIGLLDLFGIKYQTIVYQSENKKRYHLLALQLLNKKRAFNCFCSNEVLEKKRKSSKIAHKAYRYDGTCENLPADDIIDNENFFSVRLKKPLTAIDFIDKIKGNKHFKPEDIDNFIILRQDKMPTYNFACAVDDMLSDISLVIRGEDHLSNTPKQIAVQLALGYTKKIEYAHLPIILNSNGKKMSKRDDASSVKWLLQEGFIPQAIINYLILLGNNPPKEIFSLQEAISFFDINKLSKSKAKFDIKKLRFINREQLKLMNDLELSNFVGFADADIGKLAKLYLQEVSTTKELKKKIEIIFSEKKAEGKYSSYIKEFKVLLKQAPPFENFSKLKEYVTTKSGTNGKKFFKPIRILLTGAKHGPKLDELYPYIKNYLTEIIR